jgi:hypothetical protein
VGLDLWHRSDRPCAVAKCPPNPNPWCVWSVPCLLAEPCLSNADDGWASRIGWWPPLQLLWLNQRRRPQRAEKPLLNHGVQGAAWCVRRLPLGLSAFAQVLAPKSSLTAFFGQRTYPPLAIEPGHSLGTTPQDRRGGAASCERCARDGTCGWPTTPTQRKHQISSAVSLQTQSWPPFAACLRLHESLACRATPLKVRRGNVHKQGSHLSIC